MHTDGYDRVCAAPVEVAQSMPMGRGLDEQNALGPLQNRAQYDIVARLVDAARDSGATILIGGDPDEGAAAHFYPVTLVADVANDTRWWRRSSSVPRCRSCASMTSSRPFQWRTP